MQIETMRANAPPRGREIAEHRQGRPRQLGSTGEFHGAAPRETRGFPSRRSAGAGEKDEPAAVRSHRLIHLRHQAWPDGHLDLRDYLFRTRGEGGGVIAGIGASNYDPELARKASESTHGRR